MEKLMIDENNDQLIKRHQSSDYTYCLIELSMLLLVCNLAKREKLNWKMRIMADK